MNTFKNSLSVAIIAIVVISCVNSKEPQDAPGKAVPVKILRIEPYSRNEPVSYTGVAEASQSIPLSFLTSGTVDQVCFNEGEKVRKGQLIASLNSLSYQNAFEMAEAKEKQAADGYERLSSVYKNGSLPEVKMIEMETNLQQAKSALQIAKKTLDDCRLYSPVEGLIGKRSIDPGMNILSGITAFTIVSIDKIFVRISVPENEISGISRGESAIVIVPALDNRSFSGKIEQKGVVANPLSHTYEIKIALENPGHHLIPGMLCNVSLETKGTNKIIAISQQIVQKDGSGKSFVFILDSTHNVALRRDIETGNLMDDGLVEIRSGLTFHEQVISEGYQKINENSLLQILQ